MAGTPPVSRLDFNFSRPPEDASPGMVLSSQAGQVACRYSAGKSRWRRDNSDRFIRRFPLILLTFLLSTASFTAASPAPAVEPGYAYGFCYALADYYEAVERWWRFEPFGAPKHVRVAAVDVIAARKRAWRSISSESSRPGVSTFASKWREQNFGRLSLAGTSQSWQNAAASADRFVMTYCFPLLPAPTPPRSELMRHL